MGKRMYQADFLSFLFKKEQRLDWWILCGICILGFMVLKIAYPYPATISDSGGYVVSAQNNLFSFYRPFGYSFFLRVVHFLSSSIHAVFIVQMIIYFISAALFAFSIKYFFRPVDKMIWSILLFFFVCNPIAFYMANSIMSDLLFSSIMYCMLAAFMFIIMKRSWIALILFLIAMFFLLHIRYAAFLFPFVFVPFLFTMKGWIRWVSIIGLIFIYILFRGQVQNSMKETTGFDQFSTGFDGWQLANNAIHIIPFIEQSSIKKKELREIHEFVLLYKAKILEVTKNGTEVSASFLWSNDLPLKMYHRETMMRRNWPYPLAWIQLGSRQYKDYGKYLITHYPIQFIQRYYLPNALNIVYPSCPEIMGEYLPIEWRDILNWYQIPPDSDLNCKNDIYGKFLAKTITISQLISWIIIIGIAVFAIVNRKKIHFNREEKSIFWGLFTFGAVYYASTVFAAPIMMRFWLPTIAIQFSFCYILLYKLNVSVLLPKN